ncbi:uncharacterized protein LOC102802510 [Saccoglossus kowalevskii]
MARLVPSSVLSSVPPTSKHTLFMRGFGGNVTSEDIRNFFERETKSRVTFDFCKTNVDRTKLYVAVRFKSREIAREVLSRFDYTTVLGSTLKMSWFRDLRIVRVPKGRTPPRKLYDSRSIHRLRASANPFLRKRAISPRRVYSLRDSHRFRSPSEDRVRKKSDRRSSSRHSLSPKQKSSQEHLPLESKHRSSSYSEDQPGTDKSHSPSRRSHSHSHSHSHSSHSRSRSRTPEHKRSHSPSPRIVIRTHRSVSDKKIPYSSSIYGKVATFKDLKSEHSNHYYSDGLNYGKDNTSYNKDYRKDRSSSPYKSHTYRPSSSNGATASSPEDYGSTTSRNRYESKFAQPALDLSHKYVNGDSRGSFLGSTDWSTEQLNALKQRKDEIERAYRQDCETFATVVKMLIRDSVTIEILFLNIVATKQGRTP